ncbi:MAG TPA: DUF1360 domain-containing protein [Rubrobacteraceae bacterium]|nr:DUF1360 domain-containing protein [Rubrobacteraceae bacterium]
MSEDERPEGIFEAYDKNDEVPITSYATLAGAFNLIFALFLLISRATGRSIPERIETRDILIFGAATHKLSWILAREPITSPIRAPFTELEEVKSPTKAEEKPRGTELQRTIGELLTCHFCLGMWVAAFFSYGFVLFPATARLIGAIFTMLAVSDHIHQTYKGLMERT